jgi:RNA-directed DNA polymerase
MKHKPFDIPKRLIYEAWKSVKRAAGGPGIDGITIDVYEENLSSNLYKLWNRMSSGSYFPKPVKQLVIAKSGGGSRTLGIPTVEDRVAQAVVKMKMERVLEPLFHQDSYGYRPGVSAIKAVATCRKRCWYNDWVIDLDIAGCFDNIRHDLLLKAVDKHATTKWERLYIVRWLKAGAITPGGERIETEMGTPQGAVISPLLCNLFLHYALDAWLGRELPRIPFERYADDGVYHCRSKAQAKYVLDRIGKRLKVLGLQLHPKKTKIVFCARGQAAKGTENVPRSFTFLGYDFKPRETHRDKSDKALTFTPGVGKGAKKKFLAEVKAHKIHKRTDLSLNEIAKKINPQVRGWINYFRHFRISDMYPTLHHIDRRLVKLIKRKYNVGTRKAQRQLGRIQKQTPRLFAHWGLKPVGVNYGML